jgi:hypothetical protein
VKKKTNECFAVLRRLALGLALGGAACGGGQHAGPQAGTPPPGADDLRARRERFVAKAELFGSTEVESTHEEKVDFCVEQSPPPSLMECVERAQSKAEADAC